MSSIPGFVTIEEAAAIIGVSRVSVHRYCQSGQIGAVQVNRVWLIPADRAKSFERIPVGNPNFRKTKTVKKKSRKKIS